MNIVMPALIAYLIGALPFSLLIGFAWKKDIRKSGSGNIGATNVWRNCGAVAGVLAYFADIAKGSVAVFIAMRYLPEEAPQNTVLHFIYLLVLFLPILGHIFPIYLKFKGGKGVATSAGVLLMLTPIPTLMTIAVFLGFFLWKRMISLASIIAAMSYPLMFYFLYPRKSLQSDPQNWVIYGSFDQLFAIAILLAMVILIKHRSNIIRMLKGEEYVFRKGKNK